MKRGAAVVANHSMSKPINFFECLGLPQGWHVDEQKLQQAYFEKQQQWHPDRFVGKSEAEKQEALAMSSNVNTAFLTLKTPLARAEHLLILNGSKDVYEGAQKDPEVLMQMMEYREQLEGGTPDELHGLLEIVREELSDIYSSFDAAISKKDLDAAYKSCSKMCYFSKLEMDVVAKLS